MLQRKKRRKRQRRGYKTRKRTRTYMRAFATKPLRLSDINNNFNVRVVCVQTHCLYLNIRIIKSRSQLALRNCLYMLIGIYCSSSSRDVTCLYFMHLSKKWILSFLFFLFHCMQQSYETVALEKQCNSFISFPLNN